MGNYLEIDIEDLSESKKNQKENFMQKPLGFDGLLH